MGRRYFDYCWKSILLSGLNVALLGLGLSLIALIVLVIIGLIVLVVIIGSIILFLPAAVIAFVVWLLTKDLFLAGVAFLVIAVLMIIIRR